MLGEPTNDMDTDMLAAIEDLLDSWAGTLVVVSHDRYLIERVTDQQYAVVGGHLRHLPGGVEEYLRLPAPKLPPQALAGEKVPPHGTAPAARALSGAELRAAQKERASIERRLEKLSAEIQAVHDRMAAHDQTDYEGLGKLSSELQNAEAQTAELEERWLELAETID